MNWLCNVPIRRKLTIFTILASGASLVIASVAFFVYEQVAARRAMTAAAVSTAEMLGLNSASALSFGDPPAAESTLRSLTAQPHIIGACIFDQDAKLFATYQRDVAPRSWPTSVAVGTRFTSATLETFRPITVDGEMLGTDAIIGLNTDSQTKASFKICKILTLLVQYIKCRCNCCSDNDVVLRMTQQVFLN